MTDPKSAGDGGEVNAHLIETTPGGIALPVEACSRKHVNAEVYRLAAALAEAKQEAADNEADYQGLARLIEEAGYPHLRAMIQALADAEASSRRDNQMAAMAEIKIAEARQEREAAESEVARLQERVEELKNTRDSLLREAQIQAQEMRTQRGLVRDILQICSGSLGEPGDWNAVSVVKQIVSELNEARAKVAAP